MARLPRVRSFVRNLWHGRRVDRELDAELQAYVDLLADEKVARGVPPARAEREARLALGSREGIKEEVRAVRAGALVEQALQDARYALRGLRRSPVFAAAAVLLLALGIGANTAMFSAIDALLYRPLPVSEPHRLAALYRGPEGTQAGFSFPELEALAAAPALNGTTAWARGTNWMRRDATSVRVSLHIVASNYFDVLGVAPALGTTFPVRGGAADGMAVVSERLWREHFDARPSAIGSTVRIGTVPVTVIGVAPASFTGFDAAAPADVWITLNTLARLGPGWNFRDPREIWLQLVSRLPDGVSPAAAESVLNAGRGTSAAKPLPQVRVVPAATPIFDPAARASTSRASLLVGGIAGIILLIACANVANLLLLRAASRRRELGVRLAVGATRGRLLRQVVVESLVLCAAGGLGALLLAVWILDAIVRLAPPSILPPAVGVAMDARAIGFALGLSFGSAVLFSLLTTWQAARADVAHAIKLAPGEGGPGGLVLRRGLVVLQVALSVVLLVGAGLFVRTLLATLAVSPGFDVDRVLLSSVDFTAAKLTPEVVRETGGRIRERVLALPGVDAAAFGQIVPFSGASIARPAWPAGQVVDSAREHDFLVKYSVVSDGYFRTLGMPLQGRDFSSGDVAGSTPVAIVNETLARRYWPRGSAVGQELLLPTGEGRPVAHQVIGVVPDGKYVTLTEGQEPFFYLAWAQVQRPRVTLHVRTSVEPPASLARSVRAAIASVTAEVPASDPVPMRQHLDRTLAQSRLLARLLALCGAIALVVATVGVYGLAASTVVRRTKEIGIRIALGAAPRDIVRILVSETTGLVLAGLALGTTAALLLAPLVRSALYGVRPEAPGVLAGALLLLTSVALLAAVIPARRAARVDPLATLRVD